MAADPSPSSPDVLVFGASGAVGRFLVPLLAGRFRLVSVSRSPPAEPGWLAANLDDARFPWPQTSIAVSLGPLDAFAAWLERNAATDGLRRVVALSSMSIESKNDSLDPAERALAARLADAEARIFGVAAEHGIAATLFRPTLIYGAGSDRSLAPIARFAQRWRVLPVPLGATGLRQPVHAADLAAACAAVLDNPATFGNTYPLGGGERLRFDALIRRIGAALRGPIFTPPLPVAALAFAASLSVRVPRAAIRRLRQDLIADNAAAARDFAYAPRAFRAADVLPETPVYK
ncbi:MAG TPA: NAD-dependent epimerase/dehydratase family protein [Rudaea sp.]|nr:NAD-dependent epimerase/dehydratase family protein [Rudaea sp.]